MLLSDLVDGPAGGAAAARVNGFAIDHRKVAPGTVFGAFRGSARNGEDFIPAAIAAGAVAVIARPEAQVDGALHIADPEPRQRFAALAARFFAPYPDTVVAVTGTNGKTSTVEMTRQLWRMAGHRSASVGTLGVTTADEQVKTGLTTPDIVTFLSNMSGLRTMGISHVAYEASSHGLDQYRSEGLRVAAAAFTNFSRDHLDYHQTMEEYFDAKMRLFDEVVDGQGAAVVWTGDPRSGEVVDHARRRGLTLLTVGPGGETIDLKSRTASPLGQTLVLGHGGKDWTLKLPLIGAYQAANVLAAAGLVAGDRRRVGGDIARVGASRPRARAAGARGDHPVGRAGLCRLRPHPRRARSRDRRAPAARRGPPDHPVRRRRRSRRRQAAGDGSCRGGGQRHRHRHRRQSPHRRPRRHPTRGDEGAPHAREIGGRREAIAAAIAEARDGDIVLLAGKGHETVQVIGDRVLPFDDAQVARECAA